jgi:hypothetical protein
MIPDAQSQGKRISGWEGGIRPGLGMVMVEYGNAQKVILLIFLNS